MLGDQRTGNTSNNNSNNGGGGGSNSSGWNNGDGNGGDDAYEVRDIHALTPRTPASVRTRRRDSWENGSHRSPTPSAGGEPSSEQLSSMSRELHAMVLAMAGSTAQNNHGDPVAENPVGDNNNLGRIGEEEPEETNPLAIVPDGRPLDAASSPRRVLGAPGDRAMEEVSLLRVKKEEVASKISAWQTAKIAKINNRFKREDVVITGWESEKVEKATALFNKIERRLDEKRARAMEKIQNDVARAHRKAEEKRASSEAKRGTKVARILELANLMRAVGRAPHKRSFF
uniref:Remorin n=1 Tax=Anthurium amnicola TaxID=1678845 RepID=A0A1D1YNE2_9ARAE